MVQELQGFLTVGNGDEPGNGGEVQLVVLPDNLIRKFRVMFEYPRIVLGQDQQNPADPPPHQFVKRILAEFQSVKGFLKIKGVHG